MKLYQNNLSPFARKTLVVRQEANLIDAVELQDVSGMTTDPGTIPLAKNPLGKLPVLDRDDGPALYDSRVICRYLDAFAGAGLYPAGDKQWDVLTLEATGDGIMDSAVLMVYEGRTRPPEKQSDEIVEAHWQKVTRAVSALNKLWISHLSGPLTIGHISVACALGYLDFRHAGRDWRTGNEALAAWYADFADRDSMVATRPPA